MTEKNEPQDLGQQLDELQKQAVSNSNSIEIPEGVESIGHFAEFGDQGVPRWFIYPDKPESPYQLFKTNAAAEPSSTWVYQKYKRRWAPDVFAELFGYRVKGEWYQEVYEPDARKLFPEAFEPYEAVGKRWRIEVEN